MLSLRMLCNVRNTRNDWLVHLVAVARNQFYNWLVNVVVGREAPNKIEVRIVGETSVALELCAAACFFVVRLLQTSNLERLTAKARHKKLVDFGGGREPIGIA